MRRIIEWCLVSADGIVLDDPPSGVPGHCQCANLAGDRGRSQTLGSKDRRDQHSAHLGGKTCCCIPTFTAPFLRAEYRPTNVVGSALSMLSSYP